MRTDHRRAPTGWPVVALLLVLSAASVSAEPTDRPGAAGKLSSPIAASGAGVHSPLSRFAPLKDREGVVPWSLLSAVKTRVDGKSMRPVYPSAVQSLDGREVMVQGFMMPLGTGAKQKHFLLSAVPTTCSFCVPAGPEGLVEVRTKIGVPYTQEAITVRGKMAVLPDDPYGMYYRVADGLAVP